MAKIDDVVADVEKIKQALGEMGIRAFVQFAPSASDTVVEPVVEPVADPILESATDSENS